MRDYTFKIDIENIATYMATYTALFNEVVVTPDYKQKEIIETALVVIGGKNKKDGVNYPNEIKYLMKTWINEVDELSEIENVQDKLLYLQDYVQKYLDDRENEKHKNELAARDSYIRLSEELDLLIKSLKNAIEENSKIPSNRTNDIMKHNRISMCFRNFHKVKFDGLTADDIYYYMICNKQFGQILFTQCMNCWSIKYELLWRCVKKGDFDLLKYYAAMINSKCASDNNFEWNNGAQKILSCMANAYETDLDVKYNIIDKNKVKEAIIMFANEVIPFLDEKNQSKVRNSLFKLGHRYNEEEYVAKLINDVTNYAKIPRPRGYGSRVNEISDDIRESFKILPKLGRLDVIEKILGILLKAGPNLRPMNGVRWVDSLFFWGDEAACIYIVKKCPEIMKIWVAQNRTSYDFDRVMMKIDNDQEAVKIFDKLKK